MDAPTPDRDMPPDDGDWVELLRGREAPGAEAGTRAEAIAIRRALKRSAASDRPSAEGLDRLLFTLKREGLLGPRRERLRPGYFAIAATLIAALAVPLVMQLRQQEPPEEFQTRSLGTEIKLQVSDPQHTAEALAAALREAGASVKSQTRDGYPRLDARIPTGRESVVDQVLARFHLDRGTARRLLIDIRPPLAGPDKEDPPASKP